MQKVEEHQRSPEEIKERYLTDLRSSIAGAAMTYYGEGSDNKRSVLGAYEGATTKTVILPFGRKYPELTQIEIPWQYHTSRKLGQETLLLKIGANILHLTGTVPGRKKIDEIWSIELAEMIKGGRESDAIFES